MSAATFDDPTYEAFRVAETQVAELRGPILLEEMIECARDECWRIECSARAAVAIGGVLDVGVVRRVSVQRAVATLLEACLARGKDELREFLQPQPQQRRRRA